MYVEQWPFKHPLCYVTVKLIPLRYLLCYFVQLIESRPKDMELIRQFIFNHARASGLYRKLEARGELSKLLSSLNVDKGNAFGVSMLGLGNGLYLNDLYLSLCIVLR